MMEKQVIMSTRIDGSVVGKVGSQTVGWMDGFREVKGWQRISIVTYFNVKTVMQFILILTNLMR